VSTERAGGIRKNILNSRSYNILPKKYFSNIKVGNKKRRFVMKNELCVSGFSAVSEKEMMVVEGGGVVAAVYALGFVMGMSPAGAITVCVLGAVAVGVGIYVGYHS